MNMFGDEFHVLHDDFRLRKDVPVDLLQDEALLAIKWVPWFFAEHPVMAQYEYLSSPLDRQDNGSEQDL